MPAHLSVDEPGSLNWFRVTAKPWSPVTCSQRERISDSIMSVLMSAKDRGIACSSACECDRSVLGPRSACDANGAQRRTMTGLPTVRTRRGRIAASTESRYETPQLCRVRPEWKHRSRTTIPNLTYQGIGHFVSQGLASRVAPDQRPVMIEVRPGRRRMCESEALLRNSGSTWA